MTSLPYDAYDDHDVRGQRQNQDDQFKTSSPYDANANTNDSAIKCRIASDKSGGGCVVVVINLMITKLLID